MKLSTKIKLLTILTVLFYFSKDVNAQANFVYGKQFGSDKECIALNAVTDDKGNLYIAAGGAVNPLR